MSDITGNKLKFGLLQTGTYEKIFFTVKISYFCLRAVFCIS